MFTELLVSVFFVGQAIAEGSNSYFAHIPAGQAVTVQWRDITFVVPENAFTQDVTLTLRDRGTLKDTAMPRLSKGFRSRKSVYAYFFSATPATDITVTLALNDAEYDDRRRRIFYTPIESPDTDRRWVMQRTRVYAAHNIARSTIHESTGRLILGKHPTKTELPIQNEEFTSYSGLPYSDTAIVIDEKSGKVLYEEEADKRRSIASLTKLLTTVVCLDQAPDLTTVITYQDVYNPGGATMSVRGGETLTLEHALFGALVPSANNLSMTLAHNCGLSYVDFVAAMNTYASEHGASATHVDEPTGLDPDNMSTARNLAYLSRDIFDAYPEVYEQAADYSTYSFSTLNTGRVITEQTTNLFDGRGKYEVVAFKTGYLPPQAERTLVLKVRRIGSDQTVIVVLLGNPAYRTIFDEAYGIVDWAFDNWILHNYAS